MGEKVGSSAHVCRLLSQYTTLDQNAFKAICKNKQHTFEEQALKELITTLFIQAVGCDKLSTIDPFTAFPLTRNLKFLTEFQNQRALILIVANSVLAKQNPIASQELWQALAPKGYGGASNRTQRVAQWTNWGIESMSYPAFRMLEHGYPENVVKHAKSHEEKVFKMATFLYEYLEAPQEGNHLSFSLLMVHRLIALTTQLGPVTWGSLLAAFADYFPGKKERVNALLAHYPFQNLVKPLYISCPITCRLTLDTTFHDFVIYMTLYSMEGFLGHDVSKQAADILKPALAHEPFRRTFSLFISQPKWPLHDINDNPYFAKEEMDLLLAYRMAYHFVDFHTAQENRGSTAGEMIFEWALNSNRNSIMRIDKEDYSGTIPQIFCDPKELIPKVFSLAPLYDKIGADFNTYAFSLLLLLTTMQEKKDPFIEFLLACHALSPLSITHHQILQYSHHNETIETTADLAFLAALQKSAPPTLDGTSSAFFNLFLIKDLKPEQRQEKLQTFSKQFPFSSAGTLSADLYAKALYFFVTDKITTHHIHILNLYQDDYPDLTLRYKLDLLIRIAQEEKPRQFLLETDIDPTLDPLTYLNSYKAKNYLDINVCEKFSILFPLLQSKFQEPGKLQPYLISLLRTTLTVKDLDALIEKIESSPHKISEIDLLTFLQDPFPLYNALKLLDPKKEERVKAVIALFQEKYQKTVTRDVEKGLRAHCLSPIPNEPSEQHIKYVIGRITSLNCPFSDLDLLRIFYEFLSLEKDREHIHINIEIIKLIESFIGEGQSLPPPIVADFLAYHPALTEKQHTELKNLFTNLAEYRKACMNDDSFLSPILLQKVYEALTYISAHLTDKTRQKAIQKEGKMLDLLIVPFRTFLSFASIPTSIRHVTCALPSNAKPLSSANQALLPLSTCQDLSKQFYVSWEPGKDKHLLRLSLLTQKEKTSYSTRITLNLPEAVFQQNPTLPFLLKRFVYHLGFDGGILDDNPEGLKNLNNFFKYAAIQEAWDAFDPAGIQKNNLRCAIYDFCDQLRVGLRMLFLNLATHCTAPQNYVERTDPQYLPKTAARGNTTYYEGAHYLVPYSLIQNSPDEKKGYGTKEELNWLLGPNNRKIKQVLDATSFNEPYDSQFHIILNHTPLSLPITIQVNEQHIDYDDREYKELDGEADAYHAEGYALTLQTEVSSRPIAVRVVYAPDDLKEERFPLALSWQIAQLKARIYEHHQTLGGIPLGILEQKKINN